MSGTDPTFRGSILVTLEVKAPSRDAAIARLERIADEVRSHTGQFEHDELEVVGVERTSLLDAA